MSEHNFWYLRALYFHSKMKYKVVLKMPHSSSKNVSINNYPSFKDEIFYRIKQLIITVTRENEKCIAYWIIYVD